MLLQRDFGPVTQFLMANTLLGRPIYWTAAYWVDGLLIDSGAIRLRREFALALADRPVHLLVNTHCHEDHIGNNDLLARRGVPIQAHPIALPYLARPRDLHIQFYRWWVWGTPSPSTGTPLGDTVATASYRFQVIPAPGHTPDHVALFEPEQGWLFCGDAFVGGRDTVLRQEQDLRAMITTAQRFAALPVTRLFPGSGTVRDNPGPEFIAKVTYLTGLGETICRLYQQGNDVAAICRQLFGGEHLITWISQGHFSSANLIRAYLQDAGLMAVPPQRVIRP